MKIDCIYSSDLKRAIDTTKRIAEYHPEAHVEFTPLLRERNYGRFQRQLEIEIPNWEKLYNDLDYRMPDGEKIQDVNDRLFEFLSQILDKHQNETVLCVGHGFMGKVLVAILMNTPVKDSPKLETIANATARHFAVNGYKKRKFITTDYGLI